ncbi:MAG: sigma-70 family RNA polymerase sigma factor [Planctomycetota bacterium]|nr:sigma-70 family RNA polymerase sigma factor [Planctomycetota bacterium]
MTDAQSIATHGPGGESSPPTAEGAKTPAGRQMLERAYDRFYDGLFRYCVHRVYHRETAEDVVSTTFVALAQNIAKLDGAGDEAIGRWLFRVAGNAIHSHFRQTGRRGKILANFGQERAGNPPSADDEPERLDWPAVHAAIRQLQPDQQNIVVLRFFEGLTVEEIARLTSKRPGTVRVVLWRAMKRLSGWLAHLRGEE